MTPNCFKLLGFMVTMVLSGLTASAQAAEPDSCRSIHLADVGWSDNTAINGLFTTVVKGLGYQTKIDTLALPIILESLKNKQIDVFLDHWMPAAEASIKPYLDAKQIDMLKPNLTGAGYGPVVPDYVAEAGIKDIKDLAAQGAKFNKKFFGIEPGNDGNRIFQSHIDDPSTGLKGWKVVESSEQGMLAEAQKKISHHDWVVFLGWTPHPIMGTMKLVYLSGFEKDGFGSAEVYTLTRPSYSAECANVGTFINNIKFTLPMESSIMAEIAKGKDGAVAAAAWLKQNPAVLDQWLAGVTTRDGKDGEAAVKASLGL